MLYLHHAAILCYRNAVVRTPDTDIFLILLYHAHAIRLTVFLDTGSGKQRKLINVSELAESLGDCATLLGFYVFTGDDCTREDWSFQNSREESKVPQNIQRTLE